MERELASLSRAALEEQLAQSSVRRHALLEAIDDGFCIIQFIDGPHGPLSDYLHIEANSGYQRHTGISGIVGKRLREVEPDNAQTWLDLYGKVLRTGETARFEQEFRAVGRHIEVSARGAGPVELGADGTPLAFPGVLIDIEGRRAVEAERDRALAALLKAEEALRHSQKMDAVGQLTGGLAHDFNNILAGIAGSMELMKIRLSQGRVADLERHVNAAQSAVKLAASLTQRLLAFSRRQTLDPKPSNLNRIVASMHELVCRSVGPSIAVETVAPADLWNTFVDIRQIENALLNLCLNARDAMPDGGKLTIATANQVLDDEAARQRRLAAGEYVSLSISDTGVGMPPEVLARAFDPFFTIKPAGLGMGLGLSMVYGFAGQSGGTACISSEPGQGTTICLLLPRHTGDSAWEEAPQEGGPAAAALWRKKIMVVDDEPLVRMVAVEMLEDLGYDVIEAEDGPSALALFAGHEDLDLLITDVGMPNGMTGRQLADAIRARRPDLPVMFVTGYAEQAVQILTKPFAADALARKVKELMEREGEGA